MNNKIILGMILVSVSFSLNAMEFINKTKKSFQNFSFNAMKFISETRDSFESNFISNVSSSLFAIVADNIYHGKRSNIFDLNQRTFVTVTGGWAGSLIKDGIKGCKKIPWVKSGKRKLSQSIGLRILTTGFNTTLDQSLPCSWLVYSLYADTSNRDRVAQGLVGGYLLMHFLTDYYEEFREGHRSIYSRNRGMPDTRDILLEEMGKVLLSDDSDESDEEVKTRES